MSEIDLDLLNRLEAVAMKATPGPWGWFGTDKQPYLATKHSGRVYVMGFTRSGMNGAQPMFRDSMCLRKAKDLAIFEVNRDATSASDPYVYRRDIVGFRSPDATFIAAFDPLVALSLIAEVRRLRTALADALGHAAAVDAQKDIAAAENAGLRADLAEAVEAMRPFGELARIKDYALVPVPIGHLRRAASIVSKRGGKANG